ncbi:hypothetical protein J4218_05745 [Candidatus Pacearchaeota archaeon]|nr:hypothetical protein [Candidatus Pacearchaeota archaeon]
MKKCVKIYLLTIFILGIIILSVGFYFLINNNKLNGYLIFSWGNIIGPLQPKTGPGGSNYLYGGMKQTGYRYNNAIYYIFEPKNPTPKSAPVLLYIHQVPGADGMILQADLNKPFYINMINHFVRKGYIVIFPSYGYYNASAKDWEDNIIYETKDALKKLKTEPGHVWPDENKFAISGHSLGGLMTIIVGVDAVKKGLPEPKALIFHEGVSEERSKKLCAENNITGNVYCVFNLPENYSSLNPNITLVYIIDNEMAVGPPNITREEWENLYIYGRLNKTEISRKNKFFLFTRTDIYGTIDLVSNHNSVQVLPRVFPLYGMDYYGYWKPTVAALNYAFYGKDYEYINESSDIAKDMGNWSDGTKVIPMLSGIDYGV